MGGSRRTRFISEEDVQRAKVRLFRKLDAPTVAQNSGLREFLFGINEEAYQTRREALLGVSKEDLVSVVSGSIMGDVEKEKTSQVVFGASSDSLQYLVARGWRVQRFVDGVSLKKENYGQEEGDYEGDETGKNDLKKYWLL